MELFCWLLWFWLRFYMGSIIGASQMARSVVGALAGWLVESALSASKEKTADLPTEAEGDGAQPPKKPKAPSAHQAASDEIEKIRRILNDLE